MLVGELAAFVGVSTLVAWKAHRADKQTRATGNGFAGDVRSSLERIERRLDRVEDRVDRIVLRWSDDGR